MPHSLDQILPSLQSLGLWSYWIIGLSSLLEAFFVTGIVVPGTLIVDAGGVLVQRGLLDYFDLVWFVAIGSMLGGALSYQVGRFGARRLRGRMKLENSPNYQRAERLFRRHGGLALVIGRFLGPLAGIVSFSAGISGMDRRRFALWTLIGSIPHALAHVALGYFLGDAITRVGPLVTRISLFATGAALLLAVLWRIVLRIERMLPFVLSILRSMLHAIGENEDARNWAGRHPRLSRFVTSRFDTSRFQGLSATLLSLAFLYILFLWAGAVFNVLMAEPIVQIDTRLAQLIHAFWTPTLLRAFTHVTALGGSTTVTLLFFGVGAALVLRRQTAAALGLSVALIGNVVSVALLKAIFERPRPELAYFVETSGSFPSGHAAISVAFYGMLFYIAWRRHLLGAISASLLATTLAFFIGLSRIYLIEHYLSDVLNGYLVGAMWLVIGIALTEWWAQSHPRAAKDALSDTALTKSAPVLALLVAVAAAVWVNVTYEKTINIVTVTRSQQTAADIPALFSGGKAAPTTEAITGTLLEPISLVFVAQSDGVFEAAMARAGWIRADKPGIATLTRAAWAAWTNREDSSAPVTPYFWAGLPNDYGYQKPTPDRTLRKRHHARFWKTRFITPDGARIFVGTASFDDGMDWGVLHHIAPNIDTERDTLIANLKSAGVVTQVDMFQLSTPHLGQDVAGDPWFTDGKAAIVRLR